jgi:hypothetical protein
VAMSAQSPHGSSQKLQPGPNTNAAGGVVNPADPAALVKADVLLQRQNETVVAASSRNADHILAAANDYRFIDFPDDPHFGGGQNFITRLVAKLFRRPLGKPMPIRATGGPRGAWTGVYRSCDRGRTWIGSALPGGPLDESPASKGSPTVQRSPLKDLSDQATFDGGHAETTDPFLMAGPGGRMHLVVLGFVRFPDGGVGKSRMFYASYTDRNDREGGGCFNYDFARLIDDADNYKSFNSPNPFIDKPSMGVDKDGAIYISYTVFTDAVKSKIIIARSHDGGATWKKSAPLLSLGFLRNHGTTTTVDANGVVYVAWRLFYQDWPLMVVSRSYDKGQTFLPATPISHWWPTKSLNQIIAQLKAAKLQPFDQFGDTGPANPSTATARALAFPSIAAGVVNGQSRLFAVWAERADVDPDSPTFGQPSATGSPRVMFTMSTDGGWSWTPRRAIDAGPRPEHATAGNLAPPSSPQLQPVISISGTTNPQLLVLYYEAREELAGGPLYDGQFVSGIGRQVDVRAVRINPVTGTLVAPSVQVSQYAIQANTDPASLAETAPGFPQVHRPNLTMYAGGTRAFFGDYPHLTASNVFERGSPWKWSTEPGSMLAIWTDNRDAQFPMVAGQPDILGPWPTYTPLSLNPNAPVASCAHVASRNANPYFAEIAGVVAGSPQTFKRLNIERAFVTYVENRTPEDRFFRLRLVPQAGIVPSFEQFSSDLSIDVQIFANSSRTQTVWVKRNLQNQTGFVRILVEELENSAVKPGGLRTSLMLNPDPNNEALTTVPSAAPVPPGTNKNIDVSELHNPQISAPQISAFTVKTPQISAPQISAPQISAPQISALGMPQISAPQISAPQISAPQISAPQISATAPGEPPNGHDTIFRVTNVGNTESVYDAYLNVPNVEQLLNSGNYQFQVLITRTSLVPGFTQTAAGCVPAAQTKVQVIANLQVPQISAPQISAIQNSDVSAPLTAAIATFSVAPEGGAVPVIVSDSQSTVLADEVQVQVRAIRLTPFSTGGPIYNPFAVELEVKSESTNVYNGVVQGDDPSDAPTASPATPPPPTFLVSTTANGGAGSLRQAILDANASPDVNTIWFNIGTGPQTIAPLSPLPTITNPVVIDGSSQPGYQGVPLIELNGVGAGGSNGLHLTTANSTINALVINRFSGEGIRIDGRFSTGNVISGNYIGTNAAGTAALANANSGIFIRRAGGNYVLGNVVSGNLGFAGIAICGTASFCGGGADQGNPTDAAANIVRGNYVGVAADGVSPLGNSGYGVSIDGAPDTQVGGTAPGAGNVIAFNGPPPPSESTRAGVAVFNLGAIGNQILGNSIHSNRGLGIDLSAGGVNVNDGNNDQDTGANGLLNFPELTSAIHEGGTATVNGLLRTKANTDVRIDLYYSSVCDASGHGEGQTWFATVNGLTDAAGNLSFSESIGTAQATAPVSYGAVVTSANGVHAALFPVGSRVTVSYELDPAAADVQSAPDRGVFPNSVRSMSVSFPDLAISAAAGPAGTTQTFDNVVDEPSGTRSDQVFLFAGPITSTSLLGGEPITFMETDFLSDFLLPPAEPTMLSSDALPVFSLSAHRSWVSIGTASGFTSVDFAAAPGPTPPPIGGAGLPAGAVVTATATTAEGTSEFSGCRTALAPGFVEWPVAAGGNGHVYEYVRTPGSWNAAQAAAANREFRGVAGHLATITSAAENAVVTSLADNPSNDLRGWIGLTDAADEGSFQWVTGEPFDYSNWNTGEPNNGLIGEVQGPTENYVEIFAVGLWNDISSNTGLNKGYVVEYDVNPFTAVQPCVPFSFPTPFQSLYYVSEPNGAGDRLAVGTMSPATFANLSQIPLPAQAGQKFCGQVQLAPGFFADAYVPTAGERNGDFSAFGALLIDPLTAAPFPGGIIPANRLPNPFAWRISSGPGGGTIASVSPTTGAPGQGMLVVRGTGFPNPASSVATVSNGGIRANGFILQAPSTNSAFWVRLPDDFPLGAATIQLSDPSVSAISNAFPITVSAVPGTPIIRNIRNSDGTVITTATAGSTIYVEADGIDTLGSVIRFTQGDFFGEATSTQTISNPTIGLAARVTVLEGLLPGPVSVSIRQGNGALSAPVTLTLLGVPPPQ